MLTNQYQYAVSLYTQEGAFLRENAIEPDFEPAREWTCFTGLRRRQLAVSGLDREAVVEPVWHPEAGEPYVAGFRMHIPAEGAGPVASEFSLTYFEHVAQRAAAELVEAEVLKAGDLFNYTVSAFRRPPTPSERVRTPFSIRRVSPPLEIREDQELASLIDRSVISGQPHGEDLPVFVPRHLISETVRLTQEAGPNEAGGILVGRLHRDRATQDLFVNVTAQIPARHAQSELTKLTFTADAWTAVKAAIDLRGQREIMVGWWHSHPFLKEACKGCEKRKDNSCPVTATFMSSEDLHLHRTVFARAYSVAMVVGDSPCAGLGWGLFGWRYGKVRSRGFHIVEDENSRSSQLSPVADGGARDDAP